MERRTSAHSQVRRNALLDLVGREVVLGPVVVLGDNVPRRALREGNGDGLEVVEDRERGRSPGGDVHCSGWVWVVRAALYEGWG